MTKKINTCDNAITVEADDTVMHPSHILYRFSSFTTVPIGVDENTVVAVTGGGALEDISRMQNVVQELEWE
uniref:Uncharacterized protein n=1 Tax=Romanomermis culicivorax TaxID=13658 RepID=A0A915K8L5_ROMCU